MGRKSNTSGVIPLGRNRIQFDFMLEGRRYRPSLPWIPTEANLRRARERLREIKAQIVAGTFRFAEEFRTTGSWIRLPCPWAPSPAMTCLMPSCATMMPASLGPTWRISPWPRIGKFSIRSGDRISDTFLFLVSVIRCSPASLTIAAGTRRLTTMLLALCGGPSPSATAITPRRPIQRRDYAAPASAEGSATDRPLQHPGRGNADCRTAQ